MTHPPARGGSPDVNPEGSWDWPNARARCLRLAQRLLRHPDDAEEAVQEAMIRAWRAREECRVPAARTAWLLQITRREAFRLAAPQPRSRSRAVGVSGRRTSLVTTVRARRSRKQGVVRPGTSTV